MVYLQGTRDAMRALEPFVHSLGLLAPLLHIPLT